MQREDGICSKEVVGRACRQFTRFVIMDHACILSGDEPIDTCAGNYRDLVKEGLSQNFRDRVRVVGRR